VEVAALDVVVLGLLASPDAGAGSLAWSCVLSEGVLHTDIDGREKRSGGRKTEPTTAARA